MNKLICSEEEQQDTAVFLTTFLVNAETPKQEKESRTGGPRPNCVANVIHCGATPN